MIHPKPYVVYVSRHGAALVEHHFETFPEALKEWSYLRDRYDPSDRVTMFNQNRASLSGLTEDEKKALEEAG